METTPTNNDAAPAADAAPPVDNGKPTLTVKEDKANTIKASADPKATPKDDKAAAPDFRATLSPEFKDKYKEFKTPEDVLKGYDELVKKMGKNPLVAPGENAKPEEIEAYKKELAKANGAPETAEAYSFDVPEALGEKDIYQPLVDKMRVIAHKHGVGAEAFKEMASEYLGMQAKFMEDAQAAGISFEDGVDALKKEWGTDFDNRAKKADAFFSTFKGPGAAQFREEFGNHPAAVKMFYEMALANGEDSPLTAGGGIQDVKMTLAQKQAALGELQNKPEYYNMMSPGHEQIRQQAAQLAAEIAGLKGKK